MTPTDADLGPVVVVRAARWPLRALTALGDESVEMTAAAADESDAETWPAYVEAYRKAVERQRAYLWNATRGEPRFMTALFISNPEFAGRIRGMSTDGPRNKRLRHSETTLYRYLARAVGRTEPCDLWAGVALARWGSATAVRPCAPRYAFAPSLRPFQAILRALGRREPYRTRGMWKANVSLSRNDDGSFSYCTRREDGAAQEKVFKPTSAVDTVITTIQGISARSFDDIVDYLRGRVDIDLEPAKAVLLYLAGLGVLVGGIDLPSRFASAWEAVGHAAAQLTAKDRRVWWQAYKALRRVCARLARVDDLSPEAVYRLTELAAAHIRSLAAGLSLDCPELPRVVVRCDLALPYDIELGPEFRAQIERTLREYTCFQEVYGLGDSFRRARGLRPPSTPKPAPPTGDGAPAPVRGDPVTWEAYATLLGATPDTFTRIDRWRRLLDSPEATVPPLSYVDEGYRPPPFGCLLFGVHGADLSVHGIVDEVAPLYSRYFRLWHPHLRPARDEFTIWYRERLKALSLQSGIRFCELVTPCEINPNALARPTFVDETVSVWAALPSELSLDGAEFFVDEASGTHLVRTASSDRPLAVFSFASANVGWGDPLTQLLLSTSFRVSPLGHLRASTVPFAHELTSTGPSPEKRLVSGAIIRTGRRIIHGSELQSWIAEPAESRFARWSRMLRNLGWGPLVSVRRDQEPSVLVPVGSPLALESVFEGLGNGAQTLAIEKSCSEAWMVAADGNRYITQFAAPFLRHEHAWSARNAASRHRRPELASGERASPAP
jgi:lantibiotic biosynthesis dehydratase-like protein